MTCWTMAQAPVAFNDINLKASVEQALGLTDPSQSDMLNLTDLTASNSNITDLTGLEYATQLTIAYLNGNQCHNLAPIAGLTKLTTLWLQNNPLDPAAYCIHLPLIQENNPGLDLQYDPNPHPVDSCSEIYVDDDAPLDPNAGDPSVSDPLEDGSVEHPFDAIQEAIDQATHGDTIIVREGTYTGTGNRDIQLYDKIIAIRSLNPDDPATVAATIIDCQGSASEHHRGFYFLNHHTAYPVINGLTITNGFADKGGGIFCENSRFAIENCVIAANKTVDGIRSGTEETIKGGDGGGLYCADSILLLLNCKFNQNRNGRGAHDTYQGHGGQGGGMYITDSDLMLHNCEINGNRSGVGGEWQSASGGSGGGIYVVSSSLEITNSRIVSNGAGWGGDGSDGGHGGSGGGIYGVSCNRISISATEILSNRTGSGGFGGEYEGGYGGSGGGLCFSNCSQVLIKNAFIANNRTGGGGQGIYYGGNGGSGAGICYVGNSSLKMLNTLVVDNVAGNGDGRVEIGDHPGLGGRGGGIYCVGGGLIENCTFVRNRSGLAGIITSEPYPYRNGIYGKGGGIHGDSNTQVNNSIIWNNTPDSIYGCDCANVQYCNTADYTCLDQNGNISADPLFADPDNNDFHLQSPTGRWDPANEIWVSDEAISPCINRGDPQSDWEAEPAPNAERINMGAYGGTVHASKATLSTSMLYDLIQFSSYWLFMGERTIPRGHAKIDGDLEEWSENVNWIDLDKIYHGDPADVTNAQFSLRWNSHDSKIYVAIKVEDTDHQFTDTYVDWNASDAVEIYSQGDAEGGTGFSHLSGDKQHIAQHYLIGHRTNRGSWATLGLHGSVLYDAGLEYAVKIDGDTIIYEIAVTQFDNYGGYSGGETIVTDLYPGHVIGFDVVASTRWGTDGFGMLSENTMYNKFRYAANFAQYTLMPCYDYDQNGIVNWFDFGKLIQSWYPD